MTFTAAKIEKAIKSRLTGKRVDLSGWHVMKDGESFQGPMAEGLARRFAAARNAADAQQIRECQEILEHGRILTTAERKSLNKED